MKTSILIPALIVAILSAAFAAGTSNPGTGTTGIMTIAGPLSGRILVSMAPEGYKSIDGTETAAVPAISISKLAPVTPTEADFEETGETITCDVRTLAPVFDEVPEFEEVAFEVLPIPSGLAPVAPAVADFAE